MKNMARTNNIGRLMQLSGIRKQDSSADNFQDIVREGYIKNEDQALDILRVARAHKNIRDQFKNPSLEHHLAPVKEAIDSSEFDIKGIYKPYPKPRAGSNRHLEIMQGGAQRLGESLLLWIGTETEIDYSRKPTSDAVLARKVIAKLNQNNKPHECHSKKHEQKIPAL